MNFDMTFCQGARCDKKESCARWVEHLKRELEKRKWINKRQISIAQFADHDGKCKMFIEKDGTK